MHVGLLGDLVFRFQVVPLLILVPRDVASLAEICQTGHCRVRQKAFTDWVRRHAQLLFSFDVTAAFYWAERLEKHV